MLCRRAACPNEIENTGGPGRPRQFCSSECRGLVAGGADTRPGGPRGSARLTMHDEPEVIDRIRQAAAAEGVLPGAWLRLAAHERLERVAS